MPLDANLVNSLKDMPNINGYPHEQRMAFYHGVFSVFDVLQMPEIAQEFAALRDQGMTTGAISEPAPYEETDYIG